MIQWYRKNGHRMKGMGVIRRYDTMIQIEWTENERDGRLKNKIKGKFVGNMGKIWEEI